MPYYHSTQKEMAEAVLLVLTLEPVVYENKSRKVNLKMMDVMRYIAGVNFRHG